MRVTRYHSRLCVFGSPAASTQCFNFFRVQLHAALLGMPETECLSAQRSDVDIISAVDSAHARISGCVRVRECARVRMYVDPGVGGGTSSACQQTFGFSRQADECSSQSKPATANSVCGVTDHCCLVTTLHPCRCHPCRPSAAGCALTQRSPAKG